MLSIKFRPTGKKHQRYFRVVVAEKKSKLTGRNADDLGWVNPHNNTCGLKKEKIEAWLGKGAKPTECVHNLFVRFGVVKGPKIPVHSRSKKITEEAKPVTPTSEKKDSAIEEKSQSVSESVASPENKENETDSGKEGLAETIPPDPQNREKKAEDEKVINRKFKTSDF